MPEQQFQIHIQFFVQFIGDRDMRHFGVALRAESAAVHPSERNSMSRSTSFAALLALVSIMLGGVAAVLGQIDDVVLQLVRDAARRELHLVTAEARTSSSAAAEAVAASAWVQELDVPSASVAATARLVAWLVVREQTSTAGRGS